MSVLKKHRRQPMMQSRDWDIVNKNLLPLKGIERFSEKSAVGLFPETDMWTRDHFHPGDRDPESSNSFQSGN